MQKIFIFYLTMVLTVHSINGMCIPCGVTEVAGSPYTDGVFNPTGIRYSPDNKWLAVANFTASTVNIYSINPATCQITLVDTAATGGLQPFALTFSPDSACLAVSNFITSDISIFTVNPTTGAITLLGGTPVPSVGFQPVGVAYSPDGTCLAVANEFDAGFIL